MTITPLSDDGLRLLADKILVEPLRPPKSLSLVADIITADKERIPGFGKAKVIKMGPLSEPVDFGVGDVVAIGIHAGTLLEMPAGHPERMVIEVRWVYSVYEKAETI